MCIVRRGTDGIGDAWTLLRHLPSVVIIAIDVKHLVSLDTEDTVHHIDYKQLDLPQMHKARESNIPRQNTLRQPCAGKRLAIIHHRGVATNVPVPSTTTSYSGAMSSMVMSIWREEDSKKKIKQDSKMNRGLEERKKGRTRRWFDCGEVSW